MVTNVTSWLTKDWVNFVATLMVEFSNDSVMQSIPILNRSSGKDQELILNKFKVIKFIYKSPLVIFRLLLFFSFAGLNSLFAQDTTNIPISNYKIQSTTFSWRGTTGYFDMTPWNSDAYSQGHLRFDPSGSINDFVMNYRLLLPAQGSSGYQPNYTPGYPLVVVLHDGSERGNCWNSGAGCQTANCYYQSTCYNPNVSAPAANSKLLNNDVQLLNSGSEWLAAINQAGARLPDDPLLNANAFSGFVLFPQSLNGWSGGEEDVIRLIRILLKTYPIDPNRVTIIGLGSGAVGAVRAASKANWLFAGMVAVSPPDLNGLTSISPGKLQRVPTKFYEGGNESAAIRSTRATFVQQLKNSGGVATLETFPGKNAVVWKEAISSSGFFEWIKSQRINNIHVDFSKNIVCINPDLETILRLPAGFPAYQWEIDGKSENISSSDSVRKVLNPGQYRARFSRKLSNPSEADWNPWSELVTLQISQLSAPDLTALGTRFLPDLNGATESRIQTATVAAGYQFFIDNILYPGSNSSSITIPGCTGCTESHTIHLKNSDASGCLSTRSNEIKVHYSILPTLPVPADFSGEINGQTIELAWVLDSDQERGFEIWRYAPTPGQDRWSLLAKCDENVTGYTDTTVVAGETYWYKIRAIATTAVSGYAPGNSPLVAAESLVIQLPSVSKLPQIPGNLQGEVSANQLPIPFAGNNQILIPGQSLILTGSGIDPDGYISSWNWKQVSGSALIINNPYHEQTTVTGLKAGTFEFELQATDEFGAYAFDKVKVEMKATGTNLFPVVDAGIDKVVYLGTTTAILSGRAIDPDGSIASVVWTKISGPAATLAGTTTTTLSISALTVGTYVFRLTGTDQTGLISSDEITVQVIAATSSQSIKLTWTPVPEATGYLIDLGSGLINTGSDLATWTLGFVPPNRDYRFGVRAITKAGTPSELSDRITVSTKNTGLYFQQKSGVWLNTSGTPDLRLVDWTAPDSKGKVSNLSLLAPVTDQATQYVVKFDGFLYIKTTGTYRFEAISNDAIRFELDGILRIQDNLGNLITDGAATTRSANLSLAAGAHRVVIYYMQNDGNASVQLSYYGPDTNSGTTFVPIPDLRFATFDFASPPVTPTGPGIPTNLNANFDGTNVNLSWTESTSIGSGIRVAILGSSTAFGTGASPITNSWVNQFTAWLTGFVPGSQVTNLATGGLTTNDVLPTGNAARNIIRALDSNPHYILVNLPTNDLISNIPLATTMSNFRLFRKMAQNQGVPMYVTTSQPREVSTGTTQLTLAQRQSLQVLSDSIRQLFGPYVIDIYNELTNLADYKIKTIYRFTDGVHLNNAGHSYIYNTVRNTLLPNLNTTEIYRSASDGLYSKIGTSEAGFTDTGVMAGETYFYKIRTINVNGVSAFTAPVIVTIPEDNTPPAVPSGLVVWDSSYTRIQLRWNASVDNKSVLGYEVSIDGNTLPIIQELYVGIDSLLPNTRYTITLTAIDASQNRSAPVTIEVRTKSLKQYYTKSTGEITNRATWGSDSDGNGLIPNSLDLDGTFFVVANRSSVSLTDPLVLEGKTSGLILSPGTDFTAAAQILGKVWVQENATLRLNDETLPDLQLIDPTSTLEFIKPRIVPPGIYGNLTLSGAQVLPSSTLFVNGNLVVGPEAEIQGKPTTLIEINGDADLQRTLNMADYSRFGIRFTNSSAIKLSGNVEFSGLYINEGNSLNIVSTNKVILELGSIYKNLNEVPVNGLTIETGAVLTAGNNTILISGSGSVNPGNETGRISIQNGNLEVNTSAAVTSHLQFDPIFHTLDRMDLLSIPGDLEVHSPVDVITAISVGAGQLTSHQAIRLLSSASQTARIEPLLTGTLAGEFKVQRHMPAKGGKVWRYLSSPVTNLSIAQWQSFFPITGNFANSSPGFTNNPSMYYYDESQAGYVVYPPSGTSNLEQLERGRGYTAFMRNSLSDVTLEVMGTPYQGTITYPLTGGSGNGADDGWNLIGNPYPSSIQWSSGSGWSASGLSSIISIRDNRIVNGVTVSTFNYFDAATGTGTLTDGVIAQGQAFWIQALTGNPALSSSESVKAVTDQSFFRSTSSPNRLTMVVSNGQIEDQSYLLFDKNASSTFLKSEDGFKRPNEGTFNFGTKTTDGVLVAINKLPIKCGEAIPLQLTNPKPGTYTLQITPEGIEPGIHFVLFDQQLDRSLPIDEAFEYSFQVTADAASFLNRFQIKPEPMDVQQPVILMAEDCSEPGINITQIEPGSQFTLYNGTAPLASYIPSIREDFLRIPTNALQSDSLNLSLRISLPGCNASYEVPLTFQPQVTPQLSIESEYLTGCQGESFEVSIQSDQPVHYYIYNEENKLVAEPIEGIWKTPPVKQRQQLTAVGVTADGCRDSLTLTLDPVILPTPQITFQADTLQALNVAGELHWYRDSLLISTSDYIPAPIDGSYQALVSWHGCTLASNQLILAITEIESNSNYSPYVYPNPVTGKEFTIMGLPAGFIEGQIMTSLGESVANLTLTDLPIQRISTEDLKPGEYVLRLKNATSELVTRFIVIK